MFTASPAPIAAAAASAFDGMEDDFDAPAAAPVLASPVAKTYVQNCPKCGGSGRYRGPSSYGSGCFKCGGSGKLEFKTSPEQRAAARDSAAARKVKKADADWASFAEAYPTEAAWIEARRVGFDFAGSMYEAVRKYGDLTERQLAAVQRMVIKDADREAQRVAKAAESAQIAAAAPAVAQASLEKIEAAFASAKAASIKYPKMRLDAFVFNPAPATGRNAGAIYVKSSERQGEDGKGQYLGKILAGKFLRVRECTQDEEARIVAAASDPEAAAVAFGQKFGACSICGRELTDADSIARGIGPICAERMGW